MTLELGSVEGITLICFARPPLPFPLNVGLEMDKSTKKTFQNNIGREKDMYQSSVTQVECHRLQFHWGQAQQEYFNKLKDELSSTPVLAH